MRRPVARPSSHAMSGDGGERGADELFRKRGNREDEKAEGQRTSHELKYPKPKILLMDLKDDSQEVLAAQGYNVETGSFGTPYRVEKRDSLEPVIPNATLPQSFEHEIVVIDLVANEPLDAPAGEKIVSDGAVDWWASCSEGIIDPRPRSMVGSMSQFDRILKHGGVFIIFTSPRWNYGFQIGRVVRGSYSRVEGREVPIDNWSFSSMLTEKHLEVSPDAGEEILAGSGGFLTELIIRHVNGSHFNCVLSREYNTKKEHWIVLAESKYGGCVSAAIYVANGQEHKDGWILLLPQIKKKDALLCELLEDIVPQLSPHLFPYAEEAKWITQPAYELPEIIELKSQIETIESETAKQVEVVEAKIADVRKEKKYLYDLLRETDDALVQAVIQSLRVLGFTDVIDVDQEIKEAGTEGSLREDIQIKDSSPILIVDVKGITGRPSDAEATQAQRHAHMRMKEWDRTDVNALSIINHQRHLPPLERDNNVPFRQEILNGASQSDLGLMTTWDLYRLIRSFVRNDWQPDHVKGLFYKRGRIEIVPAHYRYIGVVKQVWKKAGSVGIQVEELGFKKKDRIAFEMAVEFEVQAVTSLQLNDNDVQEAAVGAEVGILTEYAERLHAGARVYLVAEEGNSQAAKDR